MQRKRSVGTFLYSTPNLYGTLFALAGLVMYFLGIIGPFWPLIVFGLYLLGYVVAPRNPRVDLHVRNQRSAKELRAGLDRLLYTSRRRLPRDLYYKVKNIRDAIVDVLPSIPDLESSDPNVYTLRQTAAEYLPEALENYLALPPVYAKLQPIRDGKTARQLLGEQLDLLDQQMKEVVTELRRDDVDRLVIHGRFLKSKFQEEKADQR
jgi:hypothetical protein